MKWVDRHGHEIARIHFPTMPHDVSPYVEAEDGASLRLDVEYLGDRHEIWVVYEKNGEETARYNARYIDMIVWKGAHEHL